MVRLTDRPDMTLDVYCGRKTTIQQQQQYTLFSLGIKIIEESHKKGSMSALMEEKNICHQNC